MAPRVLRGAQALLTAACAQFRRRTTRELRSDSQCLWCLGQASVHIPGIHGKLSVAILALLRLHRFLAAKGRSLEP